MIHSSKYLGVNYFVKNKIYDIIIINLFLGVITLIVYRCISEREIACMIGIHNHINSPRGDNTFKYEKGIEYKHFFYYYDSAISFMDTQNLDRYYDKYSIITAYDIQDELLSEHFGLGRYNIGCIPKEYKDPILHILKQYIFLNLQYQVF